MYRVRGCRRGTDVMAACRLPLLHCAAQAHSRAHDLGIELGSGPARARQGSEGGPHARGGAGGVKMHRQLQPIPSLSRWPSLGVPIRGEWRAVFYFPFLFLLFVDAIRRIRLANVLSGEAYFLLPPFFLNYFVNYQNLVRTVPT